ncbi:MAG TPA: hypothetical protein PK728_10355 [Bacillota bacterium]|nr:hypothetical protein [Bacillota bacterium]
MARRIVLIALVVVLVIFICNNVIGRIYSMIPVQRAVFDNIQRSILESINGIKKQALPIAAEFPGREAALSSPCIAVQNYLHGNDTVELSVYNLETGEKYTVPTIGKHISGFDIEGKNVVWADLRSETRDPVQTEPSGKFTYNQSKLNWDVFLYNLETKELKQLTHNPAAQRNPRIWHNYVVWEDNRDDTTDDYYGIWNVYLYDRSYQKSKSGGG